MERERSIFVIKPEAFERREEICRYVHEHSDLRVTEHVDIEMEKSDVHELYADDLSTDLLNAAEAHLVGRMVRICVVEGDNAVEALQDLAGRHYDSAQCSEETIRRVFSVPGTIEYGSVTYFLNAVHKASRSEVGPALAWYERVRKERGPGA